VVYHLSSWGKSDQLEGEARDLPDGIQYIIISEIVHYLRSPNLLDLSVCLMIVYGSFPPMRYAASEVVSARPYTTCSIIESFDPPEIPKSSYSSRMSFVILPTAMV
jgi:hypothetical protein